MSDGARYIGTIVAIGTTLTAAGTMFGAVVTYLNHRLKRGAPALAIEPAFTWVAPEIGRFLRLRLVVRNRRDESVTIERLRVRRPWGMRVAMASSAQGGALGACERTDLTEVATNWEIAPRGQTQPVFKGSAHERTAHLDVGRRDFYFSPPPAWRGGVARIDVMIAVNSAEVRLRRIVVARHVHAAIITKTEAIASCGL